MKCGVFTRLAQKGGFKEWKTRALSLALKRGVLRVFHKKPFFLTLEAVVADEQKVPTYNTFVDGLVKYCGERGLAVKLAGDNSLFEEKPIP